MSLRGVVAVAGSKPACTWIFHAGPPFSVKPASAKYRVSPAVASPATPRRGLSAGDTATAGTPSTPFTLPHEGCATNDESFSRNTPWLTNEPPTPALALANEAERRRIAAKMVFDMIGVQKIKRAERANDGFASAKTAPKE